MAKNPKHQIDPNPDAQLRRLAKRIARKLFGDGYGTQVERLVISHKGRVYDGPKEGLTEKGCAFLALSHLRRAENALKAVGTYMNFVPYQTPTERAERLVNAGGPHIF